MSLRPSLASCGARRQIGVQLGHNSGALADCGANAFDRARADVAHGKNAGNTGLERRRTGTRGVRVLAGLNKALGVERHAAMQPTRRRFGADKQEEVTQRLFSYIARRAVTPPDTSKLPVR